MTNAELQYSLVKLEKAFNRLIEGTQVEKEDIARDLVIKRFEFTFEQAWKLLKIALEHQGIICRSPRQSFSQALRLEWITSEDTYIAMLEDRNLAVHIYDEQMAQEIFNRILDIYIPKFRELIEYFKKAIL